jgi:subtilisin family serine protease
MTRVASFCALARAPGSAPEIRREQHVFLRALRTAVPAARVGWRYRLVVNGFSVSLPRSELRLLRSLPEVRNVLPTATYAPQATTTPPQIGAPGLWGPSLDTAGQGIKIGIIDSGVDPTHPYFDPTGYTMPPGFPKGQKRFTTAKVIVARSFPPPGDRSPLATLAFTEDDDAHGTHVAGIAAGNADTMAVGRTVSGVAPRAYIGNYKVFVPTPSGLSPNANSPAIVAAIEAAVADGMNVINFSGGENEIDLRHDIVAQALDAAAAAGVVPVVAAGNDYAEVGAGSVSSPANAPDAIAVGAVAIGGTPVKRVHASFSSVGPTPISLELKPDVSAPGVDVLSSVPGGWATLQGTSMAAPHVAGAAALLAQRHPEWTVAEIKSALVQTGVDSTNESGTPLPPQFQGGGVVALGRADDPLVFAQPTGVSFGLLGRGTTASASVALTDAGGGAGQWSVAAVSRGSVPGERLSVSPEIDVPGTLELSVSVSGRAAAGDLDGYVELQNGTTVRRIPYWGHVTADRLAGHRPVPLTRPGLVHGSTAGQLSLVSRYRYPAFPRGVGVTTILRGPERVYRIRLTRSVANFGVVITSRAKGSDVEPRVVEGLDENRLTGYAALPVVFNPYLDQYGDPVPAAGALAPIPGEYAIVFDSGTRREAGSFTFRYWVNDVTPPVVRLRTKVVRGNAPVRLAATDAGSGIYAGSLKAKIDGEPADATFRDGVISVSTSGLRPGAHRVWLRVSDYQETKNTENVARILPNTRTFTAAFRIR